MTTGVVRVYRRNDVCRGTFDPLERYYYGYARGGDGRTREGKRARRTARDRTVARSLPKKHHGRSSRGIVSVVVVPVANGLLLLRSCGRSVGGGVGRRRRRRIPVPGRRMCRRALPAQPGSMSAGPGAGPVRVLCERRVRPGRGARVRRRRSAVRQQLGVCQDGKNDVHDYITVLS